MNAYELADKLNNSNTNGNLCDKAATMLRQQQAEIESLKAHPVKELTDEEITAISKEIFKDYKNFHHYQIDFARAILRKAQEK
jgi:hypothetical protein